MTTSEELTLVLNKLLKTDHLKITTLSYVNDSIYIIYSNFIIKSRFLSQEGIDQIVKELNSISDFKTSGISQFAMYFVMPKCLSFFSIVNSLDQLFFDVINGSAGNSSVLKKLLSLYRSAGPNPSDVVTWNLRRFSLSYSALSLTVPELFDKSSDVSVSGSAGYLELIEILLKRNPNVYATFFEDFAENLKGDCETFDAVFGGICGAVIEKVLNGEEDKLTVMTSEIPNLIFSVLAPMCRVPVITEFLMERSGYFSNHLADPNEASRKSILGAIWSGIAVDAPGNFEAMQSLLPKDYGPPLSQPILMTAFQSLRNNLEIVSSNLQDNFVLPLIKSHPSYRQIILKHLAALSNVNANRAKLQAESASINTDGFVMGAFALLLKLCDPFTLAGENVRKSKIPLIDMNFIYKSNQKRDEIKLICVWYIPHFVFR